MTTITQDVTDIAGVDDNTSWTFYTKQIRESDSGDSIVTTKRVRKYPVAGVLTVELDPGPAAVLAADGKTYPFTVPDTDSELWPLIQAAVTIPPSTTHQQLLDAVDAWLEVNTILWASITGKPAVIAAGATAADARAVIGVSGATAINVKDAPYNALGDGTANDATAILAAAAAVTNGSVLYFPKGDYRFATAGTAVTLSGKSRIGVVFEPGARLLMDNLSAGSGTGHGFLVKGAADGVTFVNAHVEWVTPPSTRSTGDGFQFLGYPSDSAPPGGWTTTTGPVRNVQLINCTTVNAPATGAIFMGCSDIRVVNFRPVNTLADGLHFNACRRVNVNGHTAVGVGDDGLAFVTYYHATNVWQSANGPFNQPSLGGWSNYDCVASNIIVSGGLADGLRIAGSKNVAVSNFVADGKANAGIIIDSAIATNGWHASQGVTIDNVLIESCPQGIQVQTVNANSGSNSAFWTFGVKLSNVTINNCSNWSIQTGGDGSASSAVSGIHINDVRIVTGSGGGGNGGVALLSLRDSSVRNVRMKTANGAGMFIEGQDTALTGALSTLPRHNLVLDNIRVDGGSLLLQDLFGLTAGTIQSLNSPTTGITLLRVKQAVIDSLKVSLANRGNTGTQQGVLLEKLSLVEVAKIVVEHDSNTTTTWSSLQIGGGDGTDKAAVATHIDEFVYVNTLNQTGNDIVVQSGANGPVNTVYSAAWYNGGEGSPVWRTTGVAEYVGTTSVSGVAVPTGATAAIVDVIAPGAGGGSGRRGAAGTVRGGGASGGSGGITIGIRVKAADLGATYNVTIPALGAGGAAVTANDTDGNAGASPGVTYFNSGAVTVAAYPGSGGAGGTNTGATAGSGNVGFSQAGVAGTNSSATGAAGSTGNFSAGCPSGGSGGGITSGDTAGNGGDGGGCYVFGGAGSRSGGVVDSTTPGAGDTAAAGTPGGAAGGGAASKTTAAQAGANATAYGAGGSGGGASLNGNNSGKGGNGGPGYVRIVWEF